MAAGWFNRMTEAAFPPFSDVGGLSPHDPTYFSTNHCPSSAVGAFYDYNLTCSASAPLCHLTLPVPPDTASSGECGCRAPPTAHAAVNGSTVAYASTHSTPSRTSARRWRSPELERDDVRRE